MAMSNVVLMHGSFKFFGMKFCSIVTRYGVWKTFDDVLCGDGFHYDAMAG